MVKRLAPLIALALFGAPAVSFGLGLGEIEMRSALNQPMNAEIKLVSVQPGDLDNLTIRLAPLDDFERLGVERIALLSKIQFTLEKRPDGSAYVKVNSTAPITEPYLDFIVEARWTRGRVLREYTMLVDPPTVVDEAPAPVRAPVAAAPSTGTSTFTPSTPAPAPTRTATIPERAELRPAISREDGLSYGPVKRDDTLWEIANQLRPDDSVSVDQVMLALVRDNPQAFYYGNINNLKAGYVLRIRDASSIGSTTQQQALAEVARHHAEWSARKSGRPVMQADAAGEAGASGSTAAASDTKAESDARLRLVSAGGEAKTSGSGADVKKLQEDLVLATEALDANRQETEDLKQRLSGLEEQLTSMQRLVELKDQEMQALQEQLRQQQAAEQATTPPSSSTQQEPQPDAMGEAKSTVDDLLALEPGLLTHPYVLGGAGILVLLVLIGVIAKRRRMQQNFQESILNVGGGSSMGAAGPMSGMAESTLVSDFSMAPMESGDEDTAEVDPISEADVYLAYGRHQQAEDILRSAMDMDPDRLELKIKLLEVLHAAKRRDAFDNQARELHARLNGNESDPMWQQVAAMGRDISPDNSLFGGTSAASMKNNIESGLASDEDDLLNFDFDLDDTKDLKDEVSARHGDKDTSAIDFDLGSLDFDMDGASAKKGKPADPDVSMLDLDMVTKKGDNSIDFDFNSGRKQTGEAPMAIETTAESDFETEHPASADDVSMILNLSGQEEEDTQELAVSADETRVDLSLHNDSEAMLDLDVVTGANGSDAPDLDLTQNALDDHGGDIFAEVDEVGTKLDLAKAYVDMGDNQGARSILDEVLEEGNPAQKEQAQELLRQIG